MTVRERIMAALQCADGPICDDHMVDRADLRRRQDSNNTCPQLADECLILRERGQCSDCLQEGKKRVKFVNTLLPVGDASSSRPVSPPPVPPPPGDGHDSERPWYWEGNVQARLVAWLTSQGYEIYRVADTASREHGPDIACAKGERKLCVGVKGYPKGGKRTRPATQARHWFAHSVFEALLYRDRDPDGRLAMAFPDFPTYRRLAGRMEWLRTNLPLEIYWVRESGGVERE